MNKIIFCQISYNVIVCVLILKLNDLSSSISNSNSNRSFPKGGIRSEVAVCDASEQNESDSDSEERTRRF